MKTLVAGIMTVALCAGLASQTLAQGDNNNTPPNRPHEGQGRFAKMDANKDGKLSWDEFLSYHTAEFKTSFQEREAKGETKLTWDQALAKHTAELKTRFQAMDTNNDGFVTKEEFRAYWQAHKGEHEGEQHHHKDQGAPNGTPAPAQN